MLFTRQLLVHTAFNEMWPENHVTSIDIKLHCLQCANSRRVLSWSLARALLYIYIYRSGWCPMPDRDLVSKSRLLAYTWTAKPKNTMTCLPEWRAETSQVKQYEKVVTRCISLLYRWDQWLAQVCKHCILFDTLTPKAQKTPRPFIEEVWSWSWRP